MAFIRASAETMKEYGERLKRSYQRQAPTCKKMLKSKEVV
jgi:hypothetical protein